MSSRPEVVYGYHGCDESVAKRILEGSDPLSPSYNAYDWLGSGIYFWEDAPERAMQWAVEMKKPHPTVVGAVIMLLAKTHIQLCVRNHAKIIRLFRA